MYSQDWAVLYDADCGFCTWAAERILAAGLRVVPLQDAEAAALLPHLTPDERMASFHLAAPDGRRWSGAQAVAPLLRLLPGGRLPAILADAAPPTTARVYGFLARHRDRLGALLGRRSCGRLP